MKTRRVRPARPADPDRIGLGLVTIVVLSLGASCGHTGTAAPARQPTAATRSVQPPAPSPTPSQEAPRPTAQETPRPTAQAAPAVAATSESAVPLTPSSAGLLSPGAVKMLQQRLCEAGTLAEQDATGTMNAVTRAAMARFQDANQLPPTGEPDEATVRKLGLDPRKIFVSGSVSTK